MTEAQAAAVAEAGGGEVDLFSKAILLRLSTGRFSVSHKIRDMGAIDVGEADKSRLRVTAALLESRELTAIYQYDTATRQQVTAWALPCDFIADGVYVMPIASWRRADAYLREREQQREPLVDRFCEVYEAAAAEGRRALRGLVDFSAYPPVAVVRRSFRFSVSWFAIGAPAGLEAIDAGAYEREAESLRASMADAVAEAREQLRVAVAGLLDHLLDRLSPGPDGTRKRFEATTVSKLVEWCDTFAERNIAGDVKLAELVTSIKRTLSGVTPAELRASAFARGSVTQALEPVKAALDGLLVTPGRFFARPADGAAGRSEGAA